MKYFTLYLLTLFLSSLQLQAEEKPTHTISVKTLVKQIKHSSSDNRRILMNRLKIKLRHMNQKSRQKIMLDLRKTFSTQHQERTPFQQHSTTPQNMGQHSMQHLQTGGHGTMQAPQMPHVPHYQHPMQHTPLKYGYPGGHR